jgi:glycolate oxidase iron-sulfur subunit
MTAWQTRWAPTATELNACVACGLCLPHCPTFRLTGDEAASPRGRLAAMSAVAVGEIPLDDAFAEVIGFCLQCRACEAACPSLVPFGRAMEGARAEVAASMTGRGRLRRRVVGRWLGSRPLVRAATIAAAIAQRIGGRTWFPSRLRAGLAGMRRLPFRRRSLVGAITPFVETPVATVGLLAGCVMDPWFTGVHEATIGVLTRAGYRVVVPEAQTCCGALAVHEGAAEDAAQLAAVNIEAFADVDLIVADAAGCSAHLAGYGHLVAGGTDFGSRAMDAVVLVARAIADGRLPSLEPSGKRVAIQDPCHLRHAQRVTAEPRAILRAAGYEVVEIDPDGLCCGAAGVYSVIRPDTSHELGERKAAQVRAVDVDLVASANPGCEMQLRSHLGEGVRVAHPIEIYAEATHVGGVIGCPRRRGLGR